MHVETEILLILIKISLRFASFKAHFQGCVEVVYGKVVFFLRDFIFQINWIWNFKNKTRIIKSLMEEETKWGVG